MSEELLGRILNEITGIRANLDGVRTEVSGLRTEFDGLPAEVSGLRAEFDGLRVEFDGLRTEVSGLRTEFDGLRAEVSGSRGEQERLRVEINRLRTGLTAQMERVLNEQGALRDDMTVVMARLDRVDATSHTAVTELRALHSQFTRLATRVTALEEPKADE